jgi:hypothetical protein
LDIQPANLDLDARPANLALEAQLGNLDPSGELGDSRSSALDDLAADAAQAEAIAEPPTAVAVAGGEAAAVGYAADPSRRNSYRQNVAGDAIEGPKRGFWADAFTSFIYPVMSGGNVLNFAVIAFISLLPIPLAFVGMMVPCYGLVLFVVGMVFVVGWLCSIFLSVVLDSAAGSDDLPSLSLKDGFVEDVLKPMFKFIGAYAIVFAPAAVLSIFLAWTGRGGAACVLVPIWLIAGAFLLPMSLLLFSFNALNMLLRIDLILLTIVRTILPYFSMWLMLLLVLVAYMLTVSADLLAQVGLESIAPNLAGLGIIGDVIITIIQTYLTLVAMRIVGLYYLHFKKRFAIVME